MMRQLFLFKFLWVVLSIFTLSSFADAPASTPQKFAQLEASAGGRLGVALIDSTGRVQMGYRADERFPFCSTFKVMVVGAILKQSIANKKLLQEKIVYTEHDLTAAKYTPVTGKHLAEGMTVAELCAAALEESDSAAVNLLIKKLGGKAAVNAFARSIGDHSFRLDRLEPQLNTAIPGDLRDTTTALAMAKSLQKLALGHILAPYQRDLLQTWLKNNTTGDKRIRAGVPAGTIVGDKTGSGDYGTVNDIALVWLPKEAPFVLAIYFTGMKAKDAPWRDEVLASAARIVLSAFIKEPAKEHS